MLRLHLQQINALEAAIAEIDREVDANLAPFRAGVELLTSIPGINTLSAQVIISEIGTDMSRFPTAGHLISWAGLCPRNDESAGKRRSTRLRQGRALVEDDARAVRLVGQPEKGQLSAGPIQPAACSTRSQEGRLRRSCFDPHRRLSHAPAGHSLPRSRPRPLRPSLQTTADQTLAQTPSRSWLRR